MRQSTKNQICHALKRSFERRALKHKKQRSALRAKNKKSAQQETNCRALKHKELRMPRAETHLGACALVETKKNNKETRLFKRKKGDEGISAFWWRAERSQRF